MRSHRPRDASLTAFARAVLAAEQRIATASVDELAARLPKRLTSPPDEFAGRLEATRRIYLIDGLVTADQLLIAIARRLQTSLRATDAVTEGHNLTLARLGGDEFTVLLTLSVGQCRSMHQPLSVVLVGVGGSQPADAEQGRVVERLLDAACRNLDGGSRPTSNS